MNRRLGRVLVWVVLGVIVTLASMALGLIATPTVSVSAAGQTVSVGATAPSLSMSGPGELDLFGQHLPTTLQFDGPVRPRLVLTHISLNSQLASLFAARGHPMVARSLGRALASGWTRYFVWEVLVTAGAALLLIGAVAGWMRLPWRRALAVLAVGLLIVEAVNAGAVMVAAYGAPAKLSRVGSLVALVGKSPLVPAAAPNGPPQSKVDAVVLGDSTAAGLGNPLVPDASARDRACGRSVDSYANALAVVNGWHVVNLACSGATVEEGLLGPQQVGGLTIPAQLPTAEHKARASLVIVSVGANDVGWSKLLLACTVAPTCDNAAFTAYFQQQLAAFSTSYLQLLQQLSAMPGHPEVLVNEYYDPFDPARHCLDREGLDHTKQQVVVSMLDALNGVLEKGAAASSFIAVQPSFAGHQLCDPQPYVQGLHSSAPLHPTQGGGLAIALADEHALVARGGRRLAGLLP